MDERGHVPGNADPSEHDLVPVADEGLRDGQADPRTAAADDHDA
ncbi:hypothetical protein ACFW3D_13545 [Streptomyces sp. NPDC058864]